MQNEEAQKGQESCLDSCRRTSLRGPVQLLAVAVLLVWCPFATAAISGIISAGYYHTCAISRTGSASCWGANSANQTRVPKSYARFRVLSNNTFNNNTWSILYDWQLNNGSAFNFTDPNLDFWIADSDSNEITFQSVGSWKSISAGYSHTCAINDVSRLFCWGVGKTRQSLLPQWILKGHDYLEWRSVSSGTSNSCGIMTNGTGVCWGANEEGQSNLPSTISNWSMIDCGYAHCCGVSVNGTGKCWGWNGVTAGRLVPYGQGTVPSSVSAWKSISAGFVHSCGVDVDGKGYCWGNNENEQLEVPQELEDAESQLTIFTPFNHTPSVVPARWTSLCSSYFHTCGLTVNGSVLCWGNNDASQAEPPVALGQNIAWITTGFVHNCGVNTSGYPICWGPAPHGPKNYWYQGQTAVPDGFFELRNLNPV